MSTLPRPISVAIETTCRAGGVALGCGDELHDVEPFDATRRAATQVIARLDDLLKRNGLSARDVEELYVSAGPGSFTGTRVGVTAARTLGQAVESIKLVGVPTVAAVALAAEDAEIKHLAVVLDARRGEIYVARFDREGDDLVPAGKPAVTRPEQLLAEAPRPLHVTGEGLGYVEVAGEGVTKLDESLWLPAVEDVWALGRSAAKAGAFTGRNELLPIYTGQPEAVRKFDANRQ